jgi:hypothetical protein
MQWSSTKRVLEQMAVSNLVSGERAVGEGTSAVLLHATVARWRLHFASWRFRADSADAKGALWSPGAKR